MEVRCTLTTMEVVLEVCTNESSFFSSNLIVQNFYPCLKLCSVTFTGGDILVITLVNSNRRFINHCGAYKLISQSFS